MHLQGGVIFTCLVNVSGFFSMNTTNLQVEVFCRSDPNDPIGPVQTIAISILERNVPPRNVTFTATPTVTLYDDTPVNTILGTFQFYDRNTAINDSAVFLSMTPCTNGRNSLTDASGISLRPTECATGKMVFVSALTR